MQQIITANAPISDCSDSSSGQGDAPEHPTLVAARVGLSNGASDCMHHTHFTHSKAVLALLL